MPRAPRTPSLESIDSGLFRSTQRLALNVFCKSQEQREQRDATSESMLSLLNAGALFPAPLTPARGSLSSLRAKGPLAWG
jgi:hypothetical protein